MKYKQLENSTFIPSFIKLVPGKSFDQLDGQERLLNDPEKITSIIFGYVEEKIASPSTVMQSIKTSGDESNIEHTNTIGIGYLPFANLPTLLKLGVEELKGDKEKDLFTISALVALSGVMTKIKGVYRQREYYPNLFFMVLASAASGKGVMMYAKELVQDIHEHFVNDSKKVQAEFRHTLKSKKASTIKSVPPFKVAIIPANCSSSKLMQHLSDNSPDTPQIMIESEMDTLSTATASEWGNFSDVLRKVFQNEPATISRRGNNNEFLEVASPKMSVLLSGTMGQIFKLINNDEDGLYSRFMVMSLSNDPIWNNVGPCPDCTNLTQFFREQAKEYFKLWDFISKKELFVELTPGQWEIINSFGNTKNREVHEDYGDNASSIVKRHGLMFFKLCMILTGIRKYENKVSADSMICRQDDFDTAFYLINKSLESSLEIFDLLPKLKSPQSTKSEMRLLEILPEKFQRSDAIEIGKKFKIGERTTDRVIRKLLKDNRLSQPKMGEYLKV